MANHAMHSGTPVRVHGHVEGLLSLHEFSEAEKFFDTNTIVKLVISVLYEN